MNGSVRTSVCLSVCLSVCPSVRLFVCLSVTPFSLCSNHRIFIYIYEIFRSLTIDRSDARAKGQGHRSKVMVTQVKINFVPIWAFPDRNSGLNSQLATKWCTKLEVAGKTFSRSFVKIQDHTGQKIADFDPNLAFPNCSSSLD